MSSKINKDRKSASDQNTTKRTDHEQIESNAGEKCATNESGTRKREYPEQNKQPSNKRPNLNERKDGKQQQIPVVSGMSTRHNYQGNNSDSSGPSGLRKYM